MYEVSQLECIDLKTDHLQDTTLIGADSYAVEIGGCLCVSVGERQVAIFVKRTRVLDSVQNVDWIPIL